MTLNEIARRAYENAHKKGFHSLDYSFRSIKGGLTRLRLSWLAMIGSEVGEAVEAVRNGDMGNFEEELADIIIRVCDTAACEGFDLDKAVERKMTINEGRPPMSGGKLA